ncbi:ABC-three component system protein [Exiguobacterium qingdaonense]|uniref:ABC-three component system protein n=1 Tax=Exiguobacterium qingdaonense TaxID=2751251 RepID=UPI001BE5FBD7|nr:ABC-three component system protein [Exiguobacterium qingdaonense]
MNSRNATGSWSGYLHQGKVGIFLALAYLDDLTSSDDSIAGWEVQYESAEDIDIKNGAIVVSRHQVKAYKDAMYPSSYSDVLGILEYEFKDKKLKIKSKGFQIHKVDNHGNLGDVEVQRDSRFLHTITETIGFDLTEEEFLKAYPNNKYIENPNNIQLYTYPDNLKYCSLSGTNNQDKLKMFCLEKIESILKKINHEFQDNKEQHLRIYQLLLSELDTEIRSKHLLGKSTYPSLSFQRIKSTIIDTVTQSEVNTSILRQKFVQSWIDFIQELEESRVEYQKSHEDKVQDIVSRLYQLKDEEFIQFLINLNPDKNSDKSIASVETVIDLFKVDSLKDIFFDCLLNVKENDYEIDYFGYKANGGYHLTLINRKPQAIKSVIGEMISNKLVTASIFERKYLVNEKIDNIKIFEGLQSFKNEDIKENWNRKIIEDDHFLYADLKFINLENAIKQLNEKE